MQLIAHIRAGIRGPVVIRGMSVRDLMTEAYRVRNFQISGGPGWLVTDRWNLEAHAEDVPSLEIYLQSLLEDRFQLKIHRETKELPVYELTVAKNGLKIKPSTDRGPGTRHVGRGETELQSLPFTVFVYSLARQLDHVLIDKTNLNGWYNINLQWNTDLKAEASSDRPSISTALQEQLGLKLESSKGPVEVLVIDSVRKPSEN